MMIVSEALDRVFGHLVVEVDVSEESARARFISRQEPRFFEAIVKGRKYFEIPYIVSRICGACSIAHLLASINALEKAMDIEVTEDIKLLRDLVNQLQLAQNNVVHLLFLALPDYIGVENFEMLMKKNPDIVRIGMRLNSLCLKAVELFVGRIVNPVGCNVGGFYRELDKTRFIRCTAILKEAEELARKFVDFVFQLELPKLEERTSLYAVLEAPREYLVAGESIVLSDGTRIDVEEYSKVFSEYKVEDSTSKIVLRDGKALYVGSRARVNAYYERLRSYREYIEMLAPPTRNPFDNIKAKALELLYTIQNVKNKMIELGERSLKLRVDVKPKEGEGVGAIEAPRGLLIHHYRVDKDGNIVYSNIITPTVFNAKHVEESAEVLAMAMVRGGSINIELLRKMLSMLVRAYDPCLPCATHVVLVKRGST